MPRYLADAVAKLHAKDPADRFPSTAAVAELLGGYLGELEQKGSMAYTPAAGPRNPAHRPRRLVRRIGWVALLVAVGVAVWLAPTAARYASGVSPVTITGDRGLRAVRITRDGEVVKAWEYHDNTRYTFAADLPAGRYRIETECAPGCSIRDVGVVTRYPTGSVGDYQFSEPTRELVVHRGYKSDVEIRVRDGTPGDDPGAIPEAIPAGQGRVVVTTDTPVRVSVDRAAPSPQPGYNGDLDPATVNSVNFPAAPGEYVLRALQPDGAVLREHRFTLAAGQRVEIPITIAASPLAAGPTDLIPLARPGESQGRWVVEGGKLVHPARKVVNWPPAVPLAVAAPDEFDLDAEFERQRGADFIGFGMSARGRRFQVAFDSWREYAGLQDVDGMLLDKNPTRRKGPWLTNGKRHVARVEVRSTGVRAWLDGKEAVDYRGGFDRLAARPPGLADAVRFYVQANEDCGFVVHKLVLTPRPAK